jgi:hypothetical protein
MVSYRNTTRSLFQGGFIGWLRGVTPTLHPSPGTVVGSWIAGSGRGGYLVASVEGDFSSASGRGSAIFLVEG